MAAVGPAAFSTACNAERTALEKRLCELGRCNQFADFMQRELSSAQISGTRIRINAQGRDLGSTLDGGQLVGHQNHDAIRVSDSVFDNLNPNGVPYDESRSSHVLLNARAFRSQMSS